MTRVAEAAAAGAHLVAFPEMVLTAYPVEDLALRESFVEASRRALVAAGGRPGHRRVRRPAGRRRIPRPGRRVAPLDADPGRTLPQNCAAVIHGGRVVGRYAKHHLPNYGVFDEYRIFAPGESLTVVRVRGVDVAIAICEDLWQEGGPGRRRPATRAPSCCSSSTVPRTSGRRTTRGSSWSGGGRHRPGARSPTSTWSAARTSWSSTATRWWSGPTGWCSPAARSSSSRWSSWTWS